MDRESLHANRLTAGDEVRIIGALVRLIHSGERNEHFLVKAAVHEIGCSRLDMRESELAWVRAVADELLEAID